jgi:hypothetical protein
MDDGQRPPPNATYTMADGLLGPASKPYERKRKKMKKSVFIILLSMVLVVFAINAGVASEMVVIQGQVTEDSQIQDQEGNLFDIADTEKGSELVENVGQKVEIEGTVMEDGGVKIITVESFRIIE